MGKRRGFIGKSVLALVVFTLFFAACPDEPDKNNIDDNNKDGHDIDSSLYGTWRTANGSLIVTFSADGIEWGGAVGSSYNLLPDGTKWTAKNGKIESTYSGTTNLVWNYSIDDSGNLILASPNTPATHTLVKDGSSGGVPPPETVLGSGTYGDFEYDYGATTVTITGYTGNGGAVNIPSTIDGKSVTAIKSGWSYLDGVFYQKNLTSVIIPDSVITIGDYAFRDNNLTSVTIPNSVKTIGDYAFSDNRLTTVTIPNSVTSIGLLAFYSNPLTNITVNSGNNSYIAENSFLMSKDRKSLNFYYGSAKEVTIPNGVTTIGERAFWGLGLTSVTIPNSVTSIGNYAFYNNGLTSVIIPDSVITIGDHAFLNNRLTSVTINGVKTIGPQAFVNNQLTSVSIGAGVTIGLYAFNDSGGSSGFENAYDSNNKVAGTYTRTSTSSTTWTKQ